MNETSAQDRWERRSQGPLLWLAVAFAVAYAVPVVAPDSAPWVRTLCVITNWVVWAAFAVDYSARLWLAENRMRFVRSNPLSLLAVALPLLQPLRLLKLVSMLLLAGQRARMASQVRVTTYVAGSCLGLLIFGALAVLEVERHAPGASIQSLGDALWWAFTTMTTVGYGDMAPTTGVGRILAVGLMLSGIALLGVVTANIAAWFIARFEKDEDAERRHSAAIEALTAEVRSLRAEVARLSEPESEREADRGSERVSQPASEPGGEPVPAPGSAPVPAAQTAARS
ncbi:potassium channel family protein [Streptomyces sp. MUM 178J]|uniref:potassium channel family protein n=1 Tax=Streptomyces sp. MUM 178J TaxID=2791991 RepID=UPI001F04FD27|nr:potassium channel family protein [Streptomyces sp. MUM 178J]WRQ79257.1 potassium channel family protein [Streptomyces sp. MUM 178J]